jgi:DNA-binding transcriptional LysR family regulator
MIMRLERNLGFKIFDRSTTPLTLTPEGRIYVEYLGEAIERETEMTQRIRNMSLADYGFVSVGGSCYTAYRVLAEISGEFYKRYPGVRVNIDMGNEASFGNLQEKLRRGTLDLMIGYDYEPKEFDGVILLQERLCIAMHKSLVNDAIRPYAVTRDELIAHSYDESKVFSDPSAFDSIPFIRLGHHTSTERRMKEIMGDYKTALYTIENAHHTAMHYNMMKQGLGAVMVADIHIATSGIFDDTVAYFVPDHPSAKRPLYLISRKNLQHGGASRAFYDTSLDVCRRVHGSERGADA